MGTTTTPPGTGLPVLRTCTGEFRIYACHTSVASGDLIAEKAFLSHKVHQKLLVAQLLEEDPLLATARIEVGIVTDTVEFPLENRRLLRSRPC